MRKDSFLFYLKKLSPLIIFLVFYRLHIYLGLQYEYILLPSVIIFPLYHLSQLKKDALWNTKRWSSIVGIIGQLSYYPALFLKINALPLKDLFMTISALALLIHGLMLYLELDNSREASIFYVYVVSFGVLA